MATTLHNPVTTKWSGDVGGFSYRVIENKQSIAERHVRKSSGSTKEQVNVRSRFKLASQFSALWLGILGAFLSKKAPKSGKARRYAFSVAYGVSTVENNTAMIELENFENIMNAKTHQSASADMTVHFNAVSQDIVAADGDVVSYQVVAFDENSTPIGFNTVTYVSDGTAKLIDLPVIKGEAKRYDIMAFNTTLDENTTYDGPLGNITGNDPELEISPEVYSVLIEAMSKTKGKINGIQTGSFLVV